MPDQNQNYSSSGTRYSNVTRLVLTALLSGIAFTAVIAFLVLCYRSHWKAGALRAFPQEPQPVRRFLACSRQRMQLKYSRSRSACFRRWYNQGTLPAFAHHSSMLSKCSTQTGMLVKRRPHFWVHLHCTMALRRCIATLLQDAGLREAHGFAAATLAARTRYGHEAAAARHIRKPAEWLMCQQCCAL